MEGQVMGMDYFFSYVRRLGFWVVTVWTLTLLAYFTLSAIEDSQARREIADLKAAQFEDFIKYYSVFPPFHRVLHSGRSRWISDFEVPESAFDLAPEGFLITWTERIRCDNNPYDRKIEYEPYARLVTTSNRHIKPVKRKSDLSGLKGWPATNVITGEPMKYPANDANCILESDMTIYLNHGIEKYYKLQSEVVEVRGWLL